MRSLFPSDMDIRSLEADRWSMRIFSTEPIEKAVADGKIPHIVEPSWGKNARMLIATTLQEYKRREEWAIAVDDRNAYTNQDGITGERSQPANLLRLLSQSYSVGVYNRHFGDVGPRANRYALRRPTNILSLLDYFDIESFSLVGMSEGGRICTEVALHDPFRVESLTVVNGVGVGQVGKPGKLAVTNTERIKEVVKDPASAPFVLFGAAGSTWYASRPNRVRREYKVMHEEHEHYWPKLDYLRDAGVPISIFQANQDQLIDPVTAQQKAKEHGFGLTMTEGEHYNFYDRQLMVKIISNAIEISR